MKNLVFVLGLFLVLATAVAGDSEDSALNESFQPCRSWSYHSDVGGYICRFTGSLMQVPSSYEIDNLVRAVNSLERKVEDLDRRIQQLENKP